MPINSTSSPSEILAVYADNLGYDMDGSVRKAKSFITACRALLALRPDQTTIDGTSQRFDQSQIREELDRAQRWLSRNGGVNGQRTASRRWDMRGLRS